MKSLDFLLLIFAVCSSVTYGLIIPGREERAAHHGYDSDDTITLFRRPTNAAFLVNGETRPKRVILTQPDGTFTNDIECGEPRVLTTKIIGGKEVARGGYPWMAALVYFDLSNTTVVGCGGSVITKRIVLTAAHCLRTRNSQVVAMPDEIIVGVSKLSSADRISLNTLAGLSHKKYNKMTQQNDIAIIIMDDPIIFNDYVLPICLPPSELANLNLDNRAVRTAGWGFTQSAGSKSETLLEVTIKVIPRPECREDYKSFKNVVIDDTVICAVDKINNLDSCNGDSGGPLMFAWRGKFYVIGIVSQGDIFCGSGKPGIYTNVISYMPWLLKKVQEISANFPDD